MHTFVLVQPACLSPTTVSVCPASLDPGSQLGKERSFCHRGDGVHEDTSDAAEFVLSDRAGSGPWPWPKQDGQGNNNRGKSHVHEMVELQAGSKVAAQVTCDTAVGQRARMRTYRHQQAHSQKSLCAFLPFDIVSHSCFCLSCRELTKHETFRHFEIRDMAKEANGKLSSSTNSSTSLPQLAW